MKDKRERLSWRDHLGIQLLGIGIFSTFVAIGCFVFLYSNRFIVCEWLEKQGYMLDERNEMITWLSQEAPKYKMYPTGEVDEADREMVDREYLPFLFENKDPYISFWIYDQTTGKYVTGYVADFFADNSWLLQNELFSGFVGDQNDTVNTMIKFQDGPAELIISSYRVMEILPWYLGGGLAMCIILIFFPAIIFIYSRVRYLDKIRREILEMAGGNLDMPITVKGTDEISELANELNYLRCAFKENIEGERKSYQANRELIRAVSHDLRTPLTTLYGYLEILKYGKGKENKQQEYLQKCIEKTEEIRNMSECMFEYALVFEGEEEVEKQRISMDVFWKEFLMQADELETEGFTVEIQWRPLWKPEEILFEGNPFLMKRLADNLFSNVKRYGERLQVVSVEADMQRKSLEIRMKNVILKKRTEAGSGVGLKSALRIAELHGGTLAWEEKNGCFSVWLSIPCYMDK